MADDTTTIEISHENWKWLSTLKERPSDSFDDVIRRQREQYERDVPDDDLATAYRERAEDLRDIRNDWENGQDEQPSDLETATAGHDAGAEGIMMDMGEALFGDIADGESRELQEEIEPVDMLDEPDLAD